MSARSTLALLALLVVLGAVAALVQGPCRADRPREHGALFPGLAAADVRLVSAATGAGVETRLAREGGRWRTGPGGEPADAAAADALLADLLAARVEAVVSTNAAKQSAYETAAGTGISLRLEGAGGKRLGAAVVGAHGPDYASCYVRRDGEIEVLLVSPDLRARLARPQEAWREPAPQPAPPAPGPAQPRP